MSSEPTQENFQQLLDDNLEQNFDNQPQNNIEEKKEAEQDPSQKQDDAQNQLQQTKQSEQKYNLQLQNEENKTQKDNQILDSPSHQNQESQPEPKMDEASIILEESKEQKNPTKLEIIKIFDDLLDDSYDQNNFRLIIENNFQIFMEIDKFALEFKQLSKCKKKIDLINQRLNDNFQMIFQDKETIKQLAKNDEEKQRDFVIGCALYEKIVLDSQVTEPDQILVPTIFQKPKENIYIFLKNILLKNTEEKINEFKEQAQKFDEELMKNELYQKNLKFFVKSSKKVDLINEKYLKDFKIIFEDSDEIKKKLQDDESLSQLTVIGCALYMKISLDQRIKDPDKIMVPSLLRTAPKLQKYNEFLLFTLQNEDDQENLNDIIEFLKQIEMMQAQKDTQKDQIKKIAEEIQYCIKIFEDDVQIKVKNNLYQALLELQIENFFDKDLFEEQSKQIQEQTPELGIKKQVQNKLQLEQSQKAQQDQGEKIIQEHQELLRQHELQIKTQKLFEGNQQLLNQKQIQSRFDKDPLEFLQEIIDNPNKYNEVDVEKLINQKYYENLLLDSQEAFDTIIFKLKNSMKKNLTIPDYLEQAERNLQESLNDLYQINGCAQVAEILQKYCQIKIPQLKFQKHVSKEDQIKEDFQDVSQMLPKLENKLFTIDDFSSIFEDWNIEKQFEDVKEQLKKQQMIDGEKLMYIIFDFVKRRIKFLEILNQLNQANSQCKLTQISLFTYMILHSDPQLKALLFIACAQFMAVPLITYNPWKTDPVTQMPERTIFPELVYIYEKNQAILQFKLRQEQMIAQQQYKIQNCSTLINKLFGKDFSLHTASTINEGSIEIQFDYNNGSTDHLVIADAHGYLDIETVKLLFPIFDCFIIHVQTGFEWAKNLKKDFSKLLEEEQKLFEKKFKLFEEKQLLFQKKQKQFEEEQKQFEEKQILSEEEQKILEEKQKLYEEKQKLFEEKQKLFEEEQNLLEEKQKLSEKKFITKQMIVIAHEVQSDLNFQFIEDQDSNFSLLQTMFLKDLQEISYQNLLLQFYKKLSKYYQIDNQSYKQDSYKRIESKKIYLQLVKALSQDKISEHEKDKISEHEKDKISEHEKDKISEHENAINLLEQLVEQIKRQDDLRSLDFLPMLHHIKQKCEYENKLMKDQEITNEQRIKIRNDQKSNQFNLEQTISSDVINLYKKVIKSQISMKISPSLTQIIKGYIEKVHKPLLERRARLREKVFQDQKNLDQDQKINLEQQLKITNEEFDKKWFSQELITREIYYLSQFSKDKDINEMYFKDYSNQLIQTAQPFELIDGDTLQFVSDIYEKIFSKEDKEDLLVVSVMGPQSSGKSLLMNFIFGTQFLSSAGRCTKGVYASIIKYKCRETGKNKKILILDTEGIQSAEARDPQFDKQIVYYILCISHVILMCNKGEMNAQMTDIVRLVADAVVKTRESFVQSPDIYIIFNMVAERNEQAQLECLSKLQDDLVGIGNQQDTTNKVLKITKENIYPLTFAFNMENFGPQKNYVNKPSPFFTNQIIPLKQRILQKFNDIANEKTSRYSINEWFQFANKFWSFTSTFKNLIDFQTLQQLRADEKVKSKIDLLIQTYYEDLWQTETRNIVENILKTLFLKNQGGNSISFDKLYRDYQDELNKIYEDISLKINDEYQKFCQEQSIAKELVDKRANQLPRKKEYYKNQCMIFCNEKISNFTKEKSKDVGDAAIQVKTYQYLQGDKSYTEQEAAEKFEEAFKSAKEKVQKVLKNQSEIIQEINQLVRQDFQSSLELRQINIQQEHYFLELFRNQVNVDLYCIDILKYIQENKSGSPLFYTGDKKYPNFQKILEFQDQKKFYMNFLPENMFSVETIYTYYQWRKVFDDFLNIKLLINDIVDALKLNLFKEIYDSISQNKTYDYLYYGYNYKVEDVIKKFRQECLKLGIQFLGDYKMFIPSIEYQEQQIKEFQGIKKNEIIEKKIKEQISKKTLFLGQNKIVDPYQAKEEYYYYDSKAQTYYYYDSKKPYEYKYFTLKQKEINLLEIEDYIKEYNQKLDDIHNISLISENVNVNYSKEITEICNYDCLKYFKFLSDPAKNKTYHQYNSEAQKFFFDTIDWPKIFQEIEIEVIKNFRKDQQYHENQGVEFYIQKLLKKDKQSFEVSKEFCDVKQKITRGIVIGVKQIIQKIDDELENYCMKISQNGIYWINTVAQTFTNRLAELIEIIKQIQPLNMFEDRKETEKNIFIAKLTANDEKMDQAIGEKVAKELSKLYYDEAFKFAKGEFKIIMEKQKSKFQKVSFIMDLEQKCEKLSNEIDKNPKYVITQENQKMIQELVQFYKDPKKFLDHSFQNKFDDNLKDFITQCQKSFKDQYLKKVNIVIKYFDEFLNQLKDKKADSNASMLFYWHESSTKPKNEEKNFGNFQKQAMTLYFKNVLKKQWQDEILEFKNQEICFIRNPDIILPHQSDIKSDIGYMTIQKIDQLVKKTDEISQLHKFFEQIIKSLNEYSVFLEEEKEQESGNYEMIGLALIIEDEQIQENPQDIIENKQCGIKMISRQDLIDEYQQDFKQYFIGCLEYCPLCRRQCDINHDQKDDLSSLKHECSQGHQIQGFGGSKKFDDKFAVLSTCNELRDNDVIVYKGDEIKWVKFKIEKFPNWSFETSSLNIKENRQKNVKIWNVVGKQLCKLYYDDDGIDIKFQKAENKPQIKAPNVHYILMLDDSGSMSGDYYGDQDDQINDIGDSPWRDLMKAFNGFMSLLQSNINLLQTSKVSVITHDESSNICFREEEPNIKLSSQIKPRFGDNNFDLPLYDARKLCLKNIKDYDKFVLYFMSDGVWTFPTDGIKKLVEEKQIIDKIEFHSVAFGEYANQDILKKMSDSFPNGQLSVALTAEALSHSFQKLIPNIYEQ